MRSRWLTLRTGFCALWLVLPSCLTFQVWGCAEVREHSQTTHAEPCGAWFAAGGTDSLVIELPPHVVEQVAAATSFLPTSAVGLSLTLPNLQARLCSGGPLYSPLLVLVEEEPLHVFVDEDAEGKVTSRTGGLRPSPELQVLHVLPARGEGFDREIRLHFCRTTANGGTEWLRVVVTPFTVVIDIVTFPVQLLLFLIQLTTL